MTKAFVTSFNHSSLDGVAEIVDLLVEEFRHSGFFTISCRSLPEEIRDGEILVVIDEFSEPTVVEALKKFKASHPKVILACVLTEFFSPESWARPPSLNSFKTPWQSLLFDNLLYVACFMNGRLKLFPDLRIKQPGPANYFLSFAGLIWLSALKLKNPRINILRTRSFHERGYLWFRALGLQSISRVFDIYLSLHPAIASDALATALGTTREKIHTLLVPPPIVEKPDLVKSTLAFGVDFSGSLSSYRKKQIEKVIKILETVSPGKRFSHYMERGFDDSKMHLVLSFNLPQSKTWRYSSPMRIIGAIKRGQIPIISEKFGDHPAEDLALLFPKNVNQARSLVTSLVFYRTQYIEDAWVKLQAYRNLSVENNREIIRQLLGATQNKGSKSMQQNCLSRPPSHFANSPVPEGNGNLIYQAPQNDPGHAFIIAKLE